MVKTPKELFVETLFKRHTKIDLFKRLFLKFQNPVAFFIMMSKSLGTREKDIVHRSWSKLLHGNNETPTRKHSIEQKNSPGQCYAGDTLIDIRSTLSIFHTRVELHRFFFKHEKSCKNAANRVIPNAPFKGIKIEIVNSRSVKIKINKKVPSTLNHFYHSKCGKRPTGSLQ